MAASTAVPVRMEAVAGGAGGSWCVLLQGLARLVEAHAEIEIAVIEGGGALTPPCPPT